MADYPGGNEHQIEFDQRIDREFDALVEHESYSIMAGYDRARDKKGGGMGEDFFALEANDGRIAFVVCDGVGRSFLPAIGARLLGRRILEFFRGLDDLDGQDAGIESGLRTALDGLIGHPDLDIPFNANLSRIEKNVLQEFKDGGSKSVFVSGVLDLSSKEALFAWMGDSRLRFWECGEERVDLFDPSEFTLRDHWSSKTGAVGKTHLCCIQYHSGIKIAAYSDGLAELDQRHTEESLSLPNIRKMIKVAQNQPDSDDIAVLVIDIPVSDTDILDPDESEDMLEEPGLLKEADTSIPMLQRIKKFLGR